MHCQVDGLKDGKHTLVVTVSTLNASGYWFDYIAYIPSAIVSRANAVISIENKDPSINYGTGWNRNGTGFITQTGATFNTQFTDTYFSKPLVLSPSRPVSGVVWLLSVWKPLRLNHCMDAIYKGNGKSTSLSIYNVTIQSRSSAGGAATRSGSSSISASSASAAVTITSTSASSTGSPGFATGTTNSAASMMVDGHRYRCIGRHCHHRSELDFNAGRDRNPQFVCRYFCRLVPRLFSPTSSGAGTSCSAEVSGAHANAYHSNIDRRRSCRCYFSLKRASSLLSRTPFRTH